MLIPTDLTTLGPAGTYGARAHVLVRNATNGRMLVWRYGHAAPVSSALLLCPLSVDWSVVETLTASTDQITVLLNGGRLLRDRIEPMLAALRDALGCPELQVRHVVQGPTGSVRSCFEVASDLNEFAPGVFYLAVLYAPDVDHFYTAGELCERPAEAVSAAQLRLVHGAGEIVVGVRPIRIAAFGEVITLERALDRTAVVEMSFPQIDDLLLTQVGKLKDRPDKGEH